MKRLTTKLTPAAATLLLVGALAGQAAAELYINEIYWDPPSSEDITAEYLELRGEPGKSLDGYYLIFLEGEPGAGPNGAGSIDNVFDLSGFSIGGNGFMSLRQKNNPYTVVEGANNYENSGSDITTEVLIIPPNPTIVNFDPGWGNGAGLSLPAGSPNPTTYGGESTVGASDSYEANNAVADSGKIENSAFTALLIKNEGGAPPVVDEDLDDGDDGFDHPSGKAGWEIIDSIGMANEASESEIARLYGQVNFFFDDVPPGFVPNIPDGATYDLIGFELEFAARWGNSTGQTPNDWHISNLTNSTMSGYVDDSGEYRQSNSDIMPDDQMGPPESSKQVPYGTVLTNTIGGPNFILGDYNNDGLVDLADYTVIRDGLGATHSIDDYVLWKENFGAPLVSPQSGGDLVGYSTPEPAAALLVLVACGMGLCRRIGRAV